MELALPKGDEVRRMVRRGMWLVVVVGVLGTGCTERLIGIVDVGGECDRETATESVGTGVFAISFVGKEFIPQCSAVKANQAVRIDGISACELSGDSPIPSVQNTPAVTFQIPEAGEYQFSCAMASGTIFVE